MALSFHFEQEILVKAAADKDNEVEAKPGDNNHQEDDNNNDDDNDGDGGGFARSAGGLQFWARLVCCQ